MQKTNNNVFFSILAVLIIIACFFISWLWLVPTYRQNQNGAAKLDYEVDAASGKLDSLKSAQNTINSLGDVVNQVAIAVPPTKDTKGIITTLEAIAGLNKTYIPSFQITDGTNSSSAYNTISVVFSVNGSFDNLSNFVKAVENDTKFFNIKALTLANSKDSMTLTLQLEAYTQKSSSLATISNGGE